MQGDLESRVAAAILRAGDDLRGRGLSPREAVVELARVAIALTIEEAARVADRFGCGACGMDGKAGKAIRALAPEAPDAR